MIEKCKLAANEIANLEALNTQTVSEAISVFENFSTTRFIVTNHNTKAIFDSKKRMSVLDQYVLFPEIIVALDGNDVFYSNYSDGVIKSIAAMPVYSYGTQIACIYMMEYDTIQGTLIATLQNSIFIVTLILELFVVLFSLVFSKAYSAKLRKIMVSIKHVRKGDYTHRLEMGGHDELNALSNEFNDLISRLQISENKRNQFVSDASHELKTPLASIKLLSDSILQNNVDIETAKEFVTDIGNEADRLNRMSQKLLSLTRTDCQFERDDKITYITPTVEKVVRMLSELAYDHHVQIEHKLTDEGPIRVSEDDLHQILFNLVENGIKYNKTDGTITISTKRVKDVLQIIVSDTGVGIPEDSLEHIFERFYRVDKARSRSTGGSGLGLSIVRSFVERNHGTIKVESIVGNGSVFTISFPIWNED